MTGSIWKSRGKVKIGDRANRDYIELGMMCIDLNGGGHSSDCFMVRWIAEEILENEHR